MSRAGIFARVRPGSVRLFSPTSGAQVKFNKIGASWLFPEPAERPSGEEEEEKKKVLGR